MAAITPAELAKARNFGYAVPKKKKNPMQGYVYGGAGSGVGASVAAATQNPDWGYGQIDASLRPVPPAAPAWDPNAYLNQLKGDPMYGSALESFGNALQKARLGLRGSIQDAVIRSGFDPSSKLTGDLAGYAADIDEGTREAAASNQLSTRALLEQGLARETKNLSYANAARGGLRSGMTTAGVGALTRQNQIATNDAMTQLGDAIRGGITGYHGIESGLTGQRDAAIEAVAQRLAQQQGPAPPIAAPAAPAAAPANPAGGGVSWGGQTFTTRAALSRWLGARGANFATWAANHPQAAARLS